MDPFSIVQRANDPFFVTLHGINTIAIGQISNDICATAIIVGAALLLLVPAFAMLFELG